MATGVVVVGGTTWLILTQIRVDVGLCPHVRQGQATTCLASPSTTMSLWDYLTHSRYPEYDYLLD